MILHIRTRYCWKLLQIFLLNFYMFIRLCGMHMLNIDVWIKCIFINKDSFFIFLCNLFLICSFSIKEYKQKDCSEGCAGFFLVFLCLVSLISFSFVTGEGI